MKADKKLTFILCLTTIVWFVSLCNAKISLGQTEASGVEQPIIVNGDTVEYSTDNKEITASGNVSVIYKGTKLTCDKLSVNTQTKQAKAEGHVRIEDDTGVLAGHQIRYNFQDRTGTILEAEFRSSPYFGKAKEIERINESEFVALKGYATTCDLDKPHYRIQSKKITIFPQDKIRTQSDIFYLGRTPLLYLPHYNHSLKGPLYHVRLTPGKSSDWGAYMLSAWRYDINDSTRARVYLDYRTRLGLATGFGTNYNTENFGSGDFKYYYTHEKPTRLDPEQPHEFQRYLIRLRHSWDLDERTKAIGEYYKIEDSKRQLGIEHNFLKDYFYREYEKDAQPKSYFLINHAFDYSSLSLMMQKRTNRWYTHTDGTPDEKLPEVSYDLPEYKLGESPLYFKNTSIFSNLTNKNAAPSDLDDDITRFDTYNQVSLPLKSFIFWLTPYAATRETAYSKDKDGNTLDPRTTFYSGLDLSTKFYRIFDINSNLLGMDINGIRHIITPTAKYAYVHEPTIPASKLQYFDSIDTISRSNKVSLELTNKFQTKRGQDSNPKNTVDFAVFKIGSDYSFKPKAGAGSSFSDFLFDLELMPYSWLRFESDVTYEHLGDNVKAANVDLTASFGNERSFGIGQRYERKGGKELTSEFNWRLTPKWKFRVYERYQFASIKDKGMKEQEYGLSRDLHCWIMDFTYNIDKQNGHSVWVVFKLKALPETEIKFDQSYHAPKQQEPQTSLP